MVMKIVINDDSWVIINEYIHIHDLMVMKIVIEAVIESD